jgi:hypothetical protein
MKLNKIFLFLVVISVYSCEKVIQVDLNSAAPQVVIEGEISNAAGPYQVRISKTVNFSSNNVFPPVSRAVVKITDNTGFTDSLTEASPGTYTTRSITGKPGNTYTLSVSAEGKQYTAISTMPQPVNLDSVTIEKTKIFNNTRISAVVNFKDPVGLGNYYQFTEYLNGTLLPEVFVLEDRLSDGKYISRSLFSDSSDLKNGDNLSVKMYCIDQNVYDYMRTFRRVTNNGNQSASPANPISNLSNGALGYFSAHTTQTKQVTVR